MNPRLTDAEFDLALKPDVKPTPAEAGGHWLCVLWIAPHLDAYPPLYPSHFKRFLGEEWLWIAHRFSSEVDADDFGREKAAGAAAFGIAETEVRYLRAEYFPDYPSGGA